MSTASSGVDLGRQLEAEIARCQRDPLRFASIAFDWGHGELEGHDGPREWQADVLEEIGLALRSNHELSISAAIQIAVASGHGVGKSALVAMLVLWAMSTHENTRGIVTANTDTQLRTKTWPEVAKWYRMLINKPWFNLEATKLEANDPATAQNWRVDIIPWSEHNTEAFAGLHNERKRILVIFDEASAIHDKIWEVTEGALTDDNTEIIWCVFGNPTRQTGRFAECFGRLRHRWMHRHIDSRKVEGTNKAQLDKLVEDYGEDSDTVRVRVRGEFPLQSEYQLISQEHVANARRREVVFDHNQPFVAGIDFARSGACETVLAFRCGRDGRGVKWFSWRERDSVVLAGKISKVIEDMRRSGIFVHTIFCDGGGVGGPIVDILSHAGYPTREILFGALPADQKAYVNKGSEMWGRMRDWMEYGAIPDDPELEAQLVSRDYRWNPKTMQLGLIPKDKMLAEGLPSPDRADAFALTFAEFIVPAPMIASSKNVSRVLNDLDQESPWGSDDDTMRDPDWRSHVRRI